MTQPEAPATLDLSGSEDQIAKRTYTPTDDPLVFIDDRGQKCLDVSQLVVKDRGRKDYGQMNELRKSVEKYGVLQPIGVHKNSDNQFQLDYGGRRTQAFLLAGKSKYIPFTLSPEDPLLRAASELEENLQRHNLSWTEEVEMMQKVHQLKIKVHGTKPSGEHEGWNADKTAEVLNISVPTLYNGLRMANKLKANPELKAKLAHLPMSAAVKELDKIEKTEAFTVKHTAGEIKVDANIFLGSSIDLIDKHLDDQSVSCWIVDPPFGNASISKDEGKARTAMSFTGVIKDTDNMDPDSARVLCAQMIAKMKPKMKLGGFVFMFFAFEHYEFLQNVFEANGFVIEYAPIIWYKDLTTTVASGYTYPSSYEPILYGYYREHGHRLSGDKLRNVITCKPVPKSERLHPFQKPIKLLSDLISSATNAGDLVVDTCAGSGQSLKAAKLLQRQAIGFEVNQENYARALMNLSI